MSGEMVFSNFFILYYYGREATKEDNFGDGKKLVWAKMWLYHSQLESCMQLLPVNMIKFFKFNLHTGYESYSSLIFMHNSPSGSP